MSVRVKVDEEKLAEIQRELKKEGHSLRDINRELDAEFRNFLYKGHSMEKENFETLKEIYSGELNGEEIQYIDGKGEKSDIKIEKNQTSAQIIGVLLGDGYLQNTTGKDGGIVSSHRIVITLHEDEDDLIQQVAKNIFALTGKSPTSHDLKSSKAIQLILYSKEIVEEFKKLGLQPGNKVENQIGVPKWVKTEKGLQKACLQGLVDTDGAIYRQKSDRRVIIQFKNHSQTLLNDFAEMCSNLNIETSSGGKHTVQVAKQEHVRRFTEEIKPLKSAEFSF